ncbi:MAG TPA: Hpt domain-containing protein [Oceanospirillales bacterium]|nr:Hpt domain-containing protein [Oceanospirillales bacterium]
MTDRFAQLKLKYTSTFAQKKQDLKSAWENKEMTVLENGLHKLAGSSGGYGFDELSVLCYQAMKLLDGYNPDNSNQLTEVLTQIFAILEKG